MIGKGHHHCSQQVYYLVFNRCGQIWHTHMLSTPSSYPNPAYATDTCAVLAWIKGSTNRIIEHTIGQHMARVSYSSRVRLSHGCVSTLLP